MNLILFGAQIMIKSMGIYNPFRGDVSDQALSEWIAQFEETERPVINQLLKAFRYYGSAQVAELVKGLYTDIHNSSTDLNSELWFVPVGYVAKSGSIIAYYFRVQNELQQDRFISPVDIAALPLTQKSTVVFLDDFLGTGNQALQVWNTVAEPIIKKTKCNFVYATVVAFREGIEFVKTKTGFTTFAVDVLDDCDRPFSTSSHVFETESDRNAAEKIIGKYGDRLYPNHPFGYRRTQGLLGFFYSTPNNTLPIFWSAQSGWKPLLARGDSYRDPAYLIGPPPGLSASMTTSSPNAPLDFLNLLSNFDIDIESIKQLASEFKDSKVVLVLASILKRIDIPRLTLESLLRLIRALRDLRHEREHVRSALHIVGNETALINCGSLIMRAAPSTTIDSLSRIEALAKMTDGFIGSVVIRTDGSVLGNYRYPDAPENEDLLLPKVYQRAAHASLISGGLLFLFLDDNRIAVFYAGKRVLWYRGAAWHLQPDDLYRGIRELSAIHEIEFSVLECVMRLAFLISDSGKGGLITVGDHAKVKENSNQPKTDHVEWVAIDIINTPEEVLVGIITQDGATIISGGGEIVQTMTTLRPPKEIEVEEETGRGTKHSSAAQMSKITNALCIALSVDGRITIYSKGTFAFKVMG
jgi:hypothetical protein